MSGFAGIYCFDGAPVPSGLLRQMTSALAFRGPDRQDLWCGPSAGFGHTLLSATESCSELQPLSLDGETWIVADCRIDARRQLLHELRSGAPDLEEAAPDVNLILHAWHRWGPDCVHHLFGDFVFAIWDQGSRRLFCARDHFGIKPFYYALIRNCFVFSNTLNCVRLHPSISDELDETAVADYLLFGYKLDASSTTFRDIRRLPPAHSLIVTGASSTPKRYWTLPADGRIRYRRSEDYVSHFQELLRAAVDDRLRTSRVAVFMSGGMDSSSLAATARELLDAHGAAAGLKAFTVVDDQLCSDQERHYSGLVASFLKLPVDYLIVDQYTPFQGWDDLAVRGSEPVCSPFSAIAADQFRRVQAHGRVALSGQGGDQVLLPAFGYFFDLLRHGRLWQLSADAVRCMRTLRRIPRFGFRTGFRKLISSQEPIPAMPSWLAPDLAIRLNLEARWRDRLASAPGIGPRPEAYQRLTDPSLCIDFEWNDPGETLANVEVRYPFFDVRLVEYLLAIPPVPWSFDKGILRLAMCGRLPEEVRLRPKTPYPGDSLAAHLAAPGCEWIDRFEAHPLLHRFVRREQIPTLAGCSSTDGLWTNIRPLALNLWLNSVPARSKLLDTAQIA